MYVHNIYNIAQEKTNLKEDKITLIVSKVLKTEENFNQKIEQKCSKKLEQIFRQKMLGKRQEDGGKIKIGNRRKIRYKNRRKDFQPRG